MQYSVVQYSEVNNKQNILRIDAEFYKPFFIEINKTVKSNPYKEFEKFIDLLTDYHANGGYETLKSHVELKDEIDDVLMVRTVNLENDDFSNNKYISLDAYNFLKKTKLFGGELIINKIGSPGRTYLMPKLQTPASLGMNQFLVRLKDNDYSCLLYVYFNSKYGKNIIEQRITGAVPLSIDKVSIKKLLVPDFSKTFAIQIKKLFDQKSILEESSKSLYQKAENLLLEELGLKDWKPKHQLSYVKNYSETQKAERFDAEYFQPQYDAIIEKIKSYNQKQGINKEVILDDVVKWSKGVEVGSEQYLDEGFDFIRISDFSSKGVSITSKKISSKLFTELKGKYSPKKGDILFTKDGTIGLTYLVDQNQDSIVSGAFLKLRPKIEIEAEYLTLVLNSVICKKQIEMMSGGAIIAHLKPSDAMNLQIPILKPEKQKEISLKIIDSKEKDKQSKSLLEIAKKAVEMAIESNEEKATKWIDQELEKLGVRLNSD